MNIFTEALDWVEAELADVWSSIASMNASQITAAVAQDAALIGAGLKDTLGAFSALTGQDTTAVQTLIAKIVSGISTVTAGVESNLALPVLQQVSADWATLQSTLAADAIVLPSAVESVFKAVTTLIPYVTAATGLVGAGEAEASQNSGLTADEARVILAAAKE